jgi:hypothetical protein
MTATATGIAVGIGTEAKLASTLADAITIVIISVASAAIVTNL